MIIRSLKLKNIRSYLDEEVRFPEGSTLLSGDIGSGKTTILLALEFAIFGLLRGQLSGSSLLRHGKNEGFVELKLEVDGQAVTIRRNLKRGQTVKQEAGYIIINGKRVEGTPVELKSKILELIGYPEELLTKSKSLMYRYTVYTPQEEM
jgi:exonuclease SbcC